MSETADLIELCATGDVSADTPHKAVLAGEEVAVFQIGGAYFVTQDLCTHGPGSLSEGYVEGEEIECPFHQGRFSIRTGAPTGAPCTAALKTWAAQAAGGKILVSRTPRPLAE